MENKIKELSLHCSDLSKCILSIDINNFELNQIAEWLSIAAGINKTGFDSFKYLSQSITYCESAYEFEANREKVLNELINELTIFNYIWGSLEALIDYINPKTSKQKGKINAACNFLLKKYEPLITIPLYRDYVASFSEISS